MMKTERYEAISHFWGMHYQVEQEFVVGPNEADSFKAETVAAFHALGVSDEELEEYGQMLTAELRSRGINA